MRIKLLFVILWILIFLSRGGDMLYSFSQFWLSHTLQVAIVKSHQDKGTGNADTEQALEKQKVHLNAARDSAIELLILLGLMFLFLRALNGEKTLIFTHKATAKRVTNVIEN